MSRLYVWIETDAIKTTHTARGHQCAECTINYGGSGDSKRAARVAVVWKKGDSQPQVFFDYGKGLEHSINEVQ